jgi:ribose 1,5-bisphosphokinase PhnN
MLPQIDTVTYTLQHPENQNVRSVANAVVSRNKRRLFKRGRHRENDVLEAIKKHKKQTVGREELMELERDGLL